MQLAKSELKDEWQEYEKKWEHFKHNSELALHEADDASGDIKSALSLLGSELKEAYQRIKQALTQ
jgi:hypothetical protein